jgi:YhcH/YjgK/YiaL family protein
MICACCNHLIIPEKIINPNWEKALDWIKNEKWKNLPEGKTLINRKNVYVSLMKYTNKPFEECRYETHRIYADIQIVTEGVELVDVCIREELQVTVPYSEEKDVDFMDGQAETVHRIALSYPLALVLFPEDAHKPSIALGNPAAVTKLVFKVALNPAN